MKNKTFSLINHLYISQQNITAFRLYIFNRITRTGMVTIPLVSSVLKHYHKHSKDMSFESS